MITIQGQYAAARVMIDEIDADTHRRIYHIRSVEGGPVVIP